MTKKKTINLSNDRTVKKASIADLSVVMDFIEQGKAKMIKAGNPNQWSANYPAIETIERDIVQGNCYLLYEGGKAIATFVFSVLMMVVGWTINLIMLSIVWHLQKVYMV